MEVCAHWCSTRCSHDFSTPFLADIHFMTLVLGDRVCSWGGWWKWGGGMTLRKGAAFFKQRSQALWPGETRHFFLNLRH